MGDTFTGGNEYSSDYYLKYERVKFFMQFQGVVLRHIGSGVLWEVIKTEKKEVDWSFMMKGEKTKIINVSIIKSLNSGKHKKIAAPFRYEIHSMPKGVQVLYDEQI